ncbi:uncharacterized protein LOC115717599 [Cannabis sativa]|uniref:uncharacterized protein LOC115717599 n=1 Tax=Cannabis sativa TaxID=3483 RepID=UPI0029CA5D99|nr:uncharacterized protein LOC115717599 [Cannabis sativa]
MVALKDQLRSMMDPAAFQKMKYTISTGYDLLLPPTTRMNWCKEVWSRLNIPKHNVIAWLAMLNRLKTLDRLLRFGVQVTSVCCLCNLQMETCQHLFFECSVAGQCLLEVMKWLGWHAKTSNLQQLLRLIGRSKLSKFKKDTLAAATIGLVYSLWRTRNDVIWQKSSVNPYRIIEETKWTIKS